MSELKSKHVKPKHCGVCGNQGISDITCFPSICKRNYLWFQCGGKFGYKIQKKESPKCKGCQSTYMPIEHVYKGYCCRECYEEDRKTEILRREVD